MTFKLLFLKYSQKNLKSCFKFVFLTKNFKEKYQHYVLETFFKCND